MIAGNNSYAIILLPRYVNQLHSDRIRMPKARQQNDNIPTAYTRTRVPGVDYNGPENCSHSLKGTSAERLRRD